MGFFSGVTNAIGSVFKAGTQAATTWGKNVMTGGGTGGGKGSWLTTALSLAGKVGGSLLEKKMGGDNWKPVDTSKGITVPSTGGYAMKTYAAGSARGTDVRMKTVDADTLTAEWEHRLEKSLRKKNLFT